MILHTIAKQFFCCYFEPKHAHTLPFSAAAQHCAAALFLQRRDLSADTPTTAKGWLRSQTQRWKRKKSYPQRMHRTAGFTDLKRAPLCAKQCLFARRSAAFYRTTYRTQPRRPAVFAALFAKKHKVRFLFLSDFTPYVILNLSVNFKRIGCASLFFLLALQQKQNERC